ncbi:complement C1q-like protein 3 [Aplysia californica]|uniref:Complement C1q-like protein 3 n=1 Tax=Aplysia californica TaxID=6500 RepID=A0ABM1A3I5_APLCA|nr:complement C1q-like protein 3 [Aplysia californica]
MKCFLLTFVVLLGLCAVSRASGPVAFSAGLTRHVTAAPNSKIVYDTVFTNVGGDYNPSTGSFICRTPGLYLFSVSGLSQEDKNIYLSLHVNNRATITVYSSAKYKFTGSSNNVVLKVNKNDEVNVVAQGSTALYGKIDQVYATFTGILMTEIQETFVNPVSDNSNSSCACWP